VLNDSCVKRSENERFSRVLERNHRWCAFNCGFRDKNGHNIVHCEGQFVRFRRHTRDMRRHHQRSRTLDGNQQWQKETMYGCTIDRYILLLSS
jgi:hypothetical protein